MAPIQPAQPQSLTTLLTSFTTSIQSALDALPAEESAFDAPEHGISLLDTKNELFVSYLQNLVFWLVLKIREKKESFQNGKKLDTEPSQLQQDVVKKLVELRVYLEKGVRPLEGKLKYQIDKVVRAAEESRRMRDNATLEKARKSIRADENGDSEDEEEDEDEDNEDEDEDDEEDEDNEEEEDEAADSTINELSYRPNPSAFRRPTSSTQDKDQDPTTAPSDGIYRPPRIQATSLPTTTAQEKRTRAPRQSAVLNEFLSTELSSAPLAEPSIGSTILSSGRRTQTAASRAAMLERRTYEEDNLVRLPKLSKKEKAREEGRDRRVGYGGEEWRGMEEGVGRIEEAMKGRKGKGVLEKSRKRGRDTADGDRGSGVQDGIAGEKLERKKRMLERKMNKRKGR